MNEWILFDRKAKRIDIYNDQKFSIASRFFNSWDWGLDSQLMMDDYPKAVFLDIKFEMSRQSIKQAIKARTFEKKLKIRARRVISGLINVTVICASVYAIVYIQDREDAIALYFADKYPLVKRISVYLP